MVVSLNLASLRVALIVIIIYLLKGNRTNVDIV